MKKYLSILILALLAISCYDEEAFSFEGLQKQKVIENILLTKEVLIANGVDTTQIHVVIHPDADNDLAEVTITTLLGSFLNGEKSVTGKPKIGLLGGEKKKFFSSTLRSGTVKGKNAIEVVVAEKKDSHSIDFIENVPSAIKVIPSSLALAPGLYTEIDVVVSLGARQGNVSNSYPFSLLAMDTLNKAIGTFRIKSEKCTSNVCISKYSITPDTTYVGIVKLIAETTGIDGSLQDEVEIYIIN